MFIFCQDFCDLLLEDIIQKCVDRNGPYWNIWHGQWEESLAKVILTFRAGTKLRRSHSSARQWSSHNITTSTCEQQSRFTISRALLNNTWQVQVNMATLLRCRMNHEFQAYSKKTKSCEKCDFIWIWNVILGKCVSSAIWMATPLITNMNIKCCSDSEHIVVLNNNKASIYIHVQQSYLHGHTRKRASTWGVTTKLWCRKKTKQPGVKMRHEVDSFHTVRYET